MEKQYSNYYLEAKQKFDKAQKDFDKNPNKKTATNLSNIRIEFKRIPTDKMYTKEYAEHLLIERREFEKKQISEMKNLLEVVNIESRFERGQINSKERIGQHKLNDITNPIK